MHARTPLKLESTTRPRLNHYAMNINFSPTTLTSPFGIKSKARPFSAVREGYQVQNQEMAQKVRSNLKKLKRRQKNARLMVCNGVSVASVKALSIEREAQIRRECDKLFENKLVSIEVPRESVLSTRRLMKVNQPSEEV